MEVEPERFTDVTIVIDASNVCWNATLALRTGESKGRARPPLRGLVQCVNFFEAYRLRGANVVAVGPGWWNRTDHMDTDDQTAFDQLKEAGVLLLAPENVHDDYVILGCSLTPGRIVIITNDKFRDHQEELGLQADWYEARRVPFEFINKEFVPHYKRLAAILGDVSLVNTLQSFDLPADWDATERATRSPFDDIQTHEEFAEVDPHLVGLMIGRGGKRVREIETRFGTHIKVSNGVARFSGLSPERVFWAKLAFLSVRPPERTHFSVPKSEQWAPIEVEKEVTPQKANIAPRDPVMVSSPDLMEVDDFLRPPGACPAPNNSALSSDGILRPAQSQYVSANIAPLDPLVSRLQTRPSQTAMSLKATSRYDHAESSNGLQMEMEKNSISTKSDDCRNALTSSSYSDSARSVVPPPSKTSLKASRFAIPDLKANLAPRDRLTSAPAMKQTALTLSTFEEVEGPRFNPPAKVNLAPRDMMKYQTSAQAPDSPIKRKDSEDSLSSL